MAFACFVLENLAENSPVTQRFVVADRTVLEPSFSLSTLILAFIYLYRKMVKDAMTMVMMQSIKKEEIHWATSQNNFFLKNGNFYPLETVLSHLTKLLIITCHTFLFKLISP